MSQLSKATLEECNDIVVDLQREPQLSITSIKVLLARLAELHELDDLASLIRKYDTTSPLAELE